MKKIFVSVSLFVGIFFASCENVQTIDGLIEIHDRAPTDSGKFMNQFLDKYVEKIPWAGPNPINFYWGMKQMTINDTVVSQGSVPGVSYVYNPTGLECPTVDQGIIFHGSPHSRYFAIGNWNLMQCPSEFRERDVIVHLTVTVGDQFFEWVNCPIKIKDHKGTNPFDIPWLCYTPTKVDLVADPKPTKTKN